MSDAVDFVEDEILDPITEIGSFGLFDDFDDFIEAPFRLIGDLIEPDVPEVGIQRRSQSVQSGIAAREIVYGRVKKGGALIFVGQDGSNNEFLHCVFVIANHPCERIDEIYLDGKLTATDSGAAIADEDAQLFSFDQTPDYENNVEVVAQLGKHANHSSHIDQIAHADWSADHRCLGCCYVYLKLKANRDLFRGVPNLSVVVKGKNDIYDPRDSSVGYTENAVLCQRDYLTSALGTGVPLTRVDDASFIAGANFADELVPKHDGGDSEPRFAISTVLSMSQPSTHNLEKLETVGAGRPVRSEYTWYYVRNDYTAPVLSLGPDDFAGPVKFRPVANKDQRLNSVKGVYSGEESGWEPTEYPNVSIGGYVSADGEVLEREINTDSISSPYQAQRVARLIIERSRYGSSLESAFKRKALLLTPGDRVTVNLPQVGLENAVYMVSRVGSPVKGGISLALSEDDSSIYIDDPNDRAAIVAPPVLTLPDTSPLLPLSLVVDEELYSTNNGRDFKARAVFAWADFEEREFRYDAQFKPSASSDWLSIEDYIRKPPAIQDDIQAGSYDFRVRSINALGVASEWSTLENQVFLGRTNPPPDVNELIFLESGIDWEYPDPPADLLGFEVRASEDFNAVWEDALPAHGGLITETRFFLGFNPPATTKFFVKAKSTFGVYSDNAASAINSGPGVSTQVETAITAGQMTVNGTLTTTYWGYVSDNYFNSIYNANNNETTRNAGSLTNTSVFGMTIAQVFSIAPGSNQVRVWFTGVSDLNVIDTIEYRFNSSDPWVQVSWSANQHFSIPHLQMVAMNIPGSTSAMDPSSNGAIELRFNRTP